MAWRYERCDDCRRSKLKIDEKKDIIEKTISVIISEEIESREDEFIGWNS